MEYHIFGPREQNTTEPAFKVNADPDADQNPDQGFDDQKIDKNLHLEKFSFFYQKMQFTYP
jgi:hypothetical protein